MLCRTRKRQYANEISLSWSFGERWVGKVVLYWRNSRFALRFGIVTASNLPRIQKILAQLKRKKILTIAASSNYPLGRRAGNRTLFLFDVARQITLFRDCYLPKYGRKAKGKNPVDKPLHGRIMVECLSLIAILVVNTTALNPFLLKWSTVSTIGW